MNKLGVENYLLKKKKKSWELKIVLLNLCNIAWSVIITIDDPIQMLKFIMRVLNLTKSWFMLCRLMSGVGFIGAFEALFLTYLFAAFEEFHCVCTL